MLKKTSKRGSYNKYRTLYLPKPMVDLLLVTSHITPLDLENKSEVLIGLSIINEILTKSNIYKENEEYPFHVIPMYSKYLQVKYGNNYQNYTNWLINHSVIWKDKPFEGYSSHYYLHPIDKCLELINFKISLSEIKLEDIIDTYCLKNNIIISLESIDNKGDNSIQKNRIFKEWYKIKIPITSKNKRYLTKEYEEDSVFINNAPKHIKLMGSYYRKSLDIDNEGALKHVDEMYISELSTAKNNEEEIRAYKRYSSRIASVKAIKNGRLNKTLRFNRNKTNNRLDTNLTNMASDLRPYIIGFQNMAYLDLVNSQPVLFNAMLKNYYLGASDNQIKELDEYKESTSNGQWYEKIMETFNVSRNEAKAIWMEIAYSKNKSFKHHKQIFETKFPFISSIIKKLKEVNHADFSIELQKIESKVFIDKICKELVNEGIFPFTMHDGLLVPKESMERTKEIMLNNLKMVIGVLPKIKVELI